MKKKLFLLIMIGSLSPSFLAGQLESVRKFTSPLYIDPLNIDRRDFRIINTVEYIQKAEVSYENGEYLKAARYYLLVVNNNCTDCESYYNLSRCYAMLGNADLASHFLFQAIETGYINFDAISNEESFRKIRRDPVFRSTMESIMKRSGDFGEVVWIEQTRYDRVRIFYPPGYEPEKRYPLVIALHGRGDNAVNFSRIWGDFSGRDIILAVPEGPYTYRGSGPALAGIHSWDIITGDEELMERADPEVTAYIAGISRELNDRLNISYTLLLGFSQGAAYAYAAGIRYHENFDGLVCLGGRMPDSQRYPWFISPEEISEASSMPIFIGHGIDDNTINKISAESSREILEANGYRVKLSLYNGGHYIPESVIKEALDWFAGQ